MNSMKYINFFLIFALLCGSCKKQEEEVRDLDQMAQSEEELDPSVLQQDPVLSPQETLIKEPMNL